MKPPIPISQQAAVNVAESQECFELNIALGAGLITPEAFVKRHREMIEAEIVALCQAPGSAIDPDLLSDPWEAA